MDAKKVFVLVGMVLVAGLEAAVDFFVNKDN